MNKKLLALVGIAALGIGAAGAIAFQSRAQTASTNVPAVMAIAPQENTAGDADNIQNDKNGVEEPDAAVSQDTDKETNDDQGTSSGIKQNDNKEPSENTTTDSNEVEDSN